MQNVIRVDFREREHVSRKIQLAIFVCNDTLLFLHGNGCTIIDFVLLLQRKVKVSQAQNIT